MKTIDFTNVTVRRSLLSPDVEVEDHYETVAEMLYQKSNTLAEVKFAEKLLAQVGKGPMEITETERQQLLKVVNTFYYWLKEPLLKILEE